MKKEYIFIAIYALLLGITKNLNALEYEATHENTYWFYDENNSTEDRYLGRVRSNIAWGESINLLMNQDDCSDPLATIIIHSDILKEKVAVHGDDINSWEYAKFDFLARVDDQEPFILETAILDTDFNEEGKGIFLLLLTELPEQFYMNTHNPKEFNKFLTLSVAEDNPFKPYLDEHTRMYRMQGMVPVILHMADRCLTDRNS